MRKSFRIKLVTIFLVEVVLCMVTITLASKFLLKPLFIHNSKTNMESYSVELIETVNNNPDDIAVVIDDMNISYGINTNIVDINNNVIYTNSGEKEFTTYKDNKRFEKWLNQYSRSETEMGKPFFKKVTDIGDNVKRLVCVREISENKYIVMNKAIKGIDQDTSIVSVFILVLGIAVAIIGAITWSIATKPFTDQIHKMSLITQKMAQLNFDEKINYRSFDEVGLLAESIDSMSDELKESIASLQNDVERRKHLLRDISHEIKTPITTIRGYAENVQIVCKDNEKVQKYCSIMVDECDVIDNLVREMLEMSRLESGDYECEMTSVSTEDMEQLLRQRIRTEYLSVDITINFEERLININQTLIERALMNYIKNAIKHHVPNTQIIVSGIYEQGNYIFSVTNKGQPISEKEQSLIWDAFYKNDKSRTRDGGHGVGLAIVKRIAQTHGGEAAVKSESGENTFMLILPC